MPNNDLDNVFQKKPRNLGSLTTAQPAIAQAQAQEKSKEENNWTKDKKKLGELTKNLTSDDSNALSEHRSVINSGTFASINEVWLSPTQARLKYDEKLINQLVQDFLNEDIGQMSPIVVREVQNPDDPKKHLNVISGHNRTLAWLRIYNDPKNQELIKDPRWIDKHRPKLILDNTSMSELSILVKQVRENVVRDDLSAWEIAISACKAADLLKKEDNLLKTPYNKILETEFGVRRNIRKIVSLCNIIDEFKILDDLEFYTEFSGYKISSPRPTICFFNVYKHALAKGVVNSLIEFKRLMDSKGFGEIDKDKDLLVSHFLALTFDDYIPSADEAVGSIELTNRRNPKKSQDESAIVVTNNGDDSQAESKSTHENQKPLVTEIQSEKSSTETDKLNKNNELTESKDHATVNHDQDNGSIMVTEPVAPTQQEATKPVEAIEQMVTEPVEALKQQISEPTAAIETQTKLANSFTDNELFNLLNEATKTEIANHFVELFTTSDKIEVGLFIEQLYKKLGDDFIDEVQKSFKV